MRIDCLIKKINNTELGKTGTHETYVQVPIDFDVSPIFSVPEQTIQFEDKTSKKLYDIRLTQGRELRICGMGQYYRDNDLSAGDEVCFEKIINCGVTEYKISNRKVNNSIFLRKDSKGYEVLTSDRLSFITPTIKFCSSGVDKTLEIKFQQSIKKRADSQESTDYYSILVDGVDFQNEYKGLIEICLNGDKATISSPFIWKKYSFETEEEK